MNLTEYINMIGAEKVASLLDVSLNTIYQWARLETSPKPTRAHQLIEISHGVLTWESIYAPYAAEKTKCN